MENITKKEFKKILESKKTLSYSLGFGKKGNLKK